MSQDYSSLNACIDVSESIMYMQLHDADCLWLEYNASLIAVDCWFGFSFQNNYLTNNTHYHSERMKW